MRTIFNSIRKKLFLSFGFLVLNIVLVIATALYFLFHGNAISTITHQIDQQRFELTQLFKNDLDFLRFEPARSGYFTSRSSRYFGIRDSLLASVRQRRALLEETMEAHDFRFPAYLTRVDAQILQYDSLFSLLVAKIDRKGFKDYGLEGEMRVFAHELENHRHALRMEDVLTLRRHEKDFLLRKENDYIVRFNELTERLKASTRYEKTRAILTKYQASFTELTVLYRAIGIDPADGLQGALNEKATALSGSLNAWSEETTRRKDEIIAKSAWSFSMTAIVLIVLSSIITYYTSIRFASPIKKLSSTMNKFLVHEGLNEHEINHGASADEISQLSQSFMKLSRELKKQFNEVMEQNAELQKLNSELDRFIYSVAHDLKSPLASLDGLIQLAEREINRPEFAHYFRMMNSSVVKLNGFIRDITDYAKNKRQLVRVEKVNLETLIGEIVEGLRFLPHAGELNVTVNIRGDGFFTDRTRLEIVLKNLLTNSYRYMDRSKGFCFLRIEGEITSDNIRLTVTDNGIGIADEHLHHIFNMFYRATENSNGTGIGLFLVKESVKMLRGRISVKSRLHEWTTFLLILPNLKQDSHLIPETEGVFQEV